MQLIAAIEEEARASSSFSQNQRESSSSKKEEKKKPYAKWHEDGYAGSVELPDTRVYNHIGYTSSQLTEIYLYKFNDHKILLGAS